MSKPNETVIASKAKQSRILPLKSGLPRSLRSLAMTLYLNCCLPIKTKLLDKLNWPLIISILGYGSFIYFLVLIDELSAIPTFTVASVALVFSYFAYNYSKERFRLDLMDKRLEIYQNVLIFCSRSMTYAGLSKNENEDEHTTEQKIAGIEAAHEAFRGIGYHKYKMLFGEDLDEIFEKLNKSFAVMVVKRYSPKHDGYSKWIKKEHETLKFISDTIPKLPEYFKPYLYFGDYKR